MNKYIKVLIICIIVFFNINNIYSNSLSEDNVDIYENVISKENYNNIEKLLNEIGLKINEIDDQLKKTTETEEYANYPTVRLNISTPFFGINSIIDSKLKIINNVSFADIINGYSIRNVVLKKSVKIPIFDVADIIVITKDININENMSEEDGKTILPYLFDYLKQVNSVNEFCKENIANIFKEFFVKEKKDLMNQYFNKFNELTNLKNELNNNISYYLLNSLNVNFKYDEYIEYINKYNKYSDISKDVFSKKEDILKNISEIDSFIIELKKYNEKFLKEDIIKNISDYNFKSEDLNKIINERIIFLESEIKYLKDYIKNSEEKIVIEKQYEVVNNNDLEDNNLEIKDEEKVIKKYSVNSEKIVDYLENLLFKIKEQSKKINEDLDVDIYDEEDNEIDIYKSNELINTRNEKYFKILNIINNYTIEFVTYDVGFYFNNIRNIYKDIDMNKNDIMNDFENYKFMYVYLLPSLKKIEFNYDKYNYLSNLITIKENKEYLNRIIKISESLYKEGEKIDK